MKLENVALGRLGRKTLAVDEGSVRRLDVLDEDLHLGNDTDQSLRSARRVPAREVRPPQRTFPSSLQTSACALLSTFESKYAFAELGIVLALVCLPILTLTPGGSRETCFGTKVPLRGVRCKAGYEAGALGADWEDGEDWEDWEEGGRGWAGVREGGAPERGGGSFIRRMGLAPPRKPAWEWNRES